MDTEALKALFRLYDADEAHRLWIEIVINGNFSEETIFSQLHVIREILGDQPFYGIIKKLLEPYKHRYPKVYGYANRYNSYGYGI